MLFRYIKNKRYQVSCPFCSKFWFDSLSVEKQKNALLMELDSLIVHNQDVSKIEGVVVPVKMNLISTHVYFISVYLINVKYITEMNIGSYKILKNYLIKKALKSHQ